MKTTFSFLALAVLVGLVSSSCTRPQTYHDGYGANNTINPYRVPQQSSQTFPTQNGGYTSTPEPISYPASTASKTTYSKPVDRPPVQTSYQTYMVQRGDTLYRISRKFGVTVSELQSANGIKGTLIYPGQQLEIPK